MQDPFLNAVSRRIWETKYRYRPLDGEPESDVRATWHRVARALAGVERDAALWEGRFYALLEGFGFLPGGRILAGAGTGLRVTLFNCFVMGPIEDRLEAIFDALREGALTMQQGGGVGYDFSTLRPAGTPARASGTIASGPVSFMHVWDAMCATLLSTGARRGAMMATLRCDHPDIERFVDAKQAPGALSHFNLSVQITDAFMQAVAEDEAWALVFPEDALPPGEGERVRRPWPGRRGEVVCRVLARRPARALWERILRAAYDHAEPGVLFVDRINRDNNLGYREYITATNPCGEIPLPTYGACDLGSLNLTRWVREPFTPRARMDLEGLVRAAATAVRFLDNVIDLSHYPLAAQARQAKGSRRIGLGITGLADSLAMLGLHYGSEAGRRQAAEIMRRLCHAAYAASIELAREKGAFPALDREAYLDRPFIRALPEPLRRGIARHGIRNSHLLAIAPTGTVSLLANNVSSGLEPMFGRRYTRHIRDGAGRSCSAEVEDYAYALWNRTHPGKAPPEAFVDARTLDPEAHLAMQAALQPYVDNAISKTINIPRDYPFERFSEIYARAYELGLKGCTTFRPNPVTGSVLESRREAAHCCGLDREAD